MPAAWLIEQCGLKGVRSKDVGMHRNHALVLVNYRDSSSEEILLFAKKIMRSVRKKFDISLEIEPSILSSSEKSTFSS